MSLPTKALSIRQPWAWAIFHCGKDVENRNWKAEATNRLVAFRGRVAVHAAKNMDRDDYLRAQRIAEKLGLAVPSPADLVSVRGGIIGSVEIVDIVDDYNSPWFSGPWGLVLRHPEPCEFVPCKGQLGIYTWKPADHWEPAGLSPWMRG
jgi:hypothetical protein